MREQHTIRGWAIRVSVITAALYAGAVAGIVIRDVIAQSQPVLRCGYTELTPYLHDTPQGPTGFAADVMNHAAKVAGLRLEWKRASDADLALSRQEIDVFPILTITKERSQRLHMSKAWWENDLVLLSHADSPVTTAAATASRRVLLRNRPLTVQLAQQWFPKAILVTRPHPTDTFQSFCNGEGDAIFIDSRLAEGFLLQNQLCGTGKLTISPMPEARLELATASSRQMAATADRLYDAINSLAMEGWVTRHGARYSIYSAVQSEYVRKALMTRHDSRAYQFSFAGLVIVVFILSLAFVRTRRSQAAAETAKLAAEEVSAQLAESQQRFEAFMKNSPAHAHIKDRHGRLEYVNDAGAKFRGSSADKLVGRNDFDLWPAEYADSIRINDLTVIEHQQPIQFIDRVQDRELLVLKFPVASRSGEPMVGTVALDITDQRRSERALNLSQFSIERSPEAVLWIDAPGNLLYANSTAARVAGYPQAELVGHHISSILHGSMFDHWRATWTRLHDERSILSEVDFIDAEGRRIAGELSIHLVVAAGEAEFACALWRDITERKQIEQELYIQAYHDHLTGLANRSTLSPQSGTRNGRCAGQRLVAWSSISRSRQF